VLRLALVVTFVGHLVGLSGCISKAREALAPQPESVGTLTCREVVEQCDSQCSDPLCVNRCTEQGNQEAQGQHAALLDCGQRSGCTDQACIEASCPSEIAACMGTSDAPADETAPPTEPAAPGQTPSS
jgi:hypothetical protein